MKRIAQYVSIVFMAVLATIYFSKGCEGHPPIKDSSDSLKTVIKGYIKAQDSLKSLANTKDSVRIEYVVKWRKIKLAADTVPCDSILPIIINICDSIILVDSSQIATLKQVIMADSLIILNQDLVIKTDSVTITALNKDIKKRKRREKFLVGALIVTSILAIIK